jgi:hypothetical protein
MHPYRVLLVALLLPGVGQVINNNPPRGLMMVFSILALGWISYHLTTPDHSLVGRYAGGLFVYAISVIDAYRWARYRWSFFARKRLDANGATPDQTAGAVRSIDEST